LVDYLNNNRVKLNQVTLGGSGKPTRLQDISHSQIPEEILSKYRKGVNDAIELKVKYLAEAKSLLAPDNTVPYGNYAQYKSLMGKATQAGEVVDTLGIQMRQEYVDSIGGLGVSSKFGPDSSHGENLTTPGGKNYQENLYQIPQRDIYTPYVEKMKKDFWQDTYNEAISEGFTPDRAKKFADSFVDNSSNAQMAKALGREDEFTQMFNKQKELERYTYKGGHWGGTPDVIFHTRTNELMYEPAGSNRPYRVYNVEETQSDLGQAARGHGFYDPEEAIKWEADMVSARKARDDAMDNLGKELERFDEKFIADNGREPSGMNPDWNDWHAARQDAMDADEGIRAVRQQMDEANNRYEEFDVNRAPVRGKYARKPFVTSTEGWTDRAIKQELDKALDSGSDYFSWTPGEAHVERYDLSRHIEGLAYDPSTGALDYRPKGSSGYGWESIDNNISPDQLDQYIGKEAAEKLLSVPVDEDNIHMLNGLDLKVGGEGMTGYYDKIYLKRVQEVLKKATGSKPEIEVIEVQTSAGPRKQLGVKLTDEMREKARFSDFNKGGRVTGGNAYDNDKSVENALALTREY
jgi:hypothetical protein